MQKTKPFIGREEELNFFEDLYNSPRFEFLILYGRRRIGKTFLLQEFARRHECIFFSAMEKNDPLNLKDFSEVVQRHFDGTFISAFSDWKSAFDYIGRKSQEKRTLLIIDEFPFVAAENPSVKSILQHQIDKDWLNKNIMLVLCGSNISYMQKEVMGEESPLYGRSTAQWEVQKFDFRTASNFFPNYSAIDKLIAYGILGGIPRYLTEFNPEKSISENIKDKILRPGAFLKEEPQALLRMEVRDSNVYNSILQAIAGGSNRPSEIASAIHEEQTKVNKYIGTLVNLRLVGKSVPCGEKSDSKKGIYRISDNFFRFWYKYEFTNRNYYNFIGEDAAVAEIIENINEYMGLLFEDICLQFMMSLAKDGKLPFTPYFIGKWWGNNPETHAQDDIDILALNKNKDKGIFCECKFTNKPFDEKEFDDLLISTKAIASVTESWLYVFSKSGWTKGAEEKAKKFNVRFVTVEELFSDFTSSPQN